MKFRNKLPHRFGGKVNVGGKIYDIDMNGVIDNVSSEHGALLSQGSAWVEIVDRKPIQRTKIEEPVKMDLNSLKKDDLIKLLEYKNIEFDKGMKKSELKALLEKDN